MQAPRKRPRIAFWIAISIVLGLTSKRWVGSSLDSLAVHAGDALWATCLYFFLALVRPRARSASLGVATILLSFLVEWSQAWHPPWLDETRRNSFVQLFLGTGWQWLDLPRYLAGALLAYALDRGGALGRLSSKT